MQLGAIVRIWRGVVTPEHRDAYIQYVEDTGMAAYRTTPGNLGAQIITREVPEGVEVTTLSWWTDMDAVRAFAGDQPEVAVYYPKDDQFLIRLGERVEHHVVAGAESGPGDGDVPASHLRG